MQKYQDVVLKPDGSVIQGASVLVQSFPGAVTSTIYSDDGVTTQANPMTTDSLGRFAFYAAGGRYQLVVSGTSIATQTITDILLEDGISNGLWTPRYGFDGTESPGAAYLIQRGWYNRVGDWVTATGYVIVSNKGSATGSGLCILGLPFVADATTQTPGTVFLGQVTSGVIDRPVFGYVDGGSSWFSLFKVTAGGINPTSMLHSDVATNFECRFQVTYKV
jgi:hypothetical protein